MSRILTIIKKELKRFFTDRRMLISLIAPGLLIFIIYSLLGGFIEQGFTPENEHTYIIYNDNIPDEYKLVLDNSEYEISYVDSKMTLDEIKNKILNEEIDLYISFEDDFINKVNENLTPSVTIYYNSSCNESLEIYNYYYSILLVNGTNISYNYLVNMDESINYDVATSENISAKFITMLLPFILLVFLFTGCVAISTESIAGEKERGTIATLLVTPTKRSYIAIGKIIALSITSLVSASASFFGLVGSLPKLLSSSGGEITLSMYNVVTYIQVFLIIIVTILLFTTLLSIISTFAKNVKEASQWSSLLMVFVMLLGMSSLIGMGNIQTNPIVYLIPVYNTVQCLASIFALSINSLNFIITILSNIVYIAIGVYLLARMFNSEKIMSAN